MIDLKSIERPASRLLVYYFITALFTGPFFVFVFPPLFFRYQTLRYKFDDEGVSASWGILFRREIHLTYLRVQDIHLSKGLIQRWLGLATVKLQTASGSATPELSIEGVLAADAMRDALYQKMRGSSGDDSGEQAEGSDEALALLHEIRDLLRHMARPRQSS